MSNVLSLLELVNALTRFWFCGSGWNGDENPLQDHLPTQWPVASNACATGTPTGPRLARERMRMAPQRLGSSIVKPLAPNARASAAKSIGCSSQANSGLPRKTICSHLICPSELFFTTTILSGSLYFTQVASSAINIEKPPSPTK